MWAQVLGQVQSPLVKVLILQTFLEWSEIPFSSTSTASKEAHRIPLIPYYRPLINLTGLAVPNSLL